jgi:cobalamin biosynthesis Mg chelatase CobN
MKMEEKQTRTNKYKDLREATQENQEELPVVEETAEEEDDFLSFIPKSKDAEVDESMLNPLSYETLEVDENVKSALNRVKENIGKDDFSTRMDILNRLKADHHAASINVDEEDLSEGKDVSSSPMSVQETLNEMFQEEEKEEPVIPVIVEEETTQLSKKEIKALKKQEKETAKQEKEEEKAVKRQKIEEEKAAKRQKAEEEKAFKKQEKEAKKQEKVDKKQTKEVERQQSKKKNDDKKAHPVLDFFLNLIIVLLFLAVLMFIVYTILVQMKIV